MSYFLPELKFKGDRKYLHGTDIYNNTLQWLITQRQDIHDIDFAFHRLAVRQLRLTLEILPKGVDPIAVCSFTSIEKRERIYIYEYDQVVEDSYRFQEDEIVSLTKFDLISRSAIFSSISIFSDIEVWVSMTKALHYHVFSNLKGKWLFVRGKFNKYIIQSATGERKIIIAASFNDKLTRTELLIDGANVGDIYFSIV